MMLHQSPFFATIDTIEGLEGHNKWLYICKGRAVTHLPETLLEYEIVQLTCMSRSISHRQCYMYSS